ncbi:tyrosine-protein kinase Mer-like [Branchiostoma lanceolatum]|uniref:tyrosine-protein kinase Mer-like n=1 Tax=Branchiostoma lanceolatum TaxID=7740 RepID=UPI0034567F87
MAMALFMNSFVIVSVLSQCTALQFTTHPQRREITAGNPATFVCGVRDSSVHPQVAWLKDGEVLPPGDHYEVDTANYTTGTALTLSSLDFSQTTIADRGFYRCKAWHRDAVIFSEIAQLVVFGPPTIVNNPRSLNVTPNTPFSLQCEAMGPPEPISIAWYKDGEVVAAALPSPSTYSFAGVTTRTRIRCVAENRNGRTPSEFSIVNIIVAPSVPSSLAVSDATSTSLRVSWYLSQDGYSPVTHAIVEFAETSNKGPDGSLQWNRTKVETSSPNSVVIYNLKPYTSYTIHVALENDIGQSGWSDYVVGRTAEGVPSAAPGSIQIQPSGSGADMEVSWSHVATADVNGILQGYRVGFTDAAAGGERVEDVRSSNSVILRGLDPTTNYSVQVWALTQVGDGVRSNPIMLYGTGSGGSFVVGYPAEDTVPSNDMASGNQWSVKKMDLVIGGSITGLILTMVVMTYACCKCHRKRRAKAGKRDPETASTVPMMQHTTPIKSKAAKSFSKKLAAEVQSFRLSPNMTESVVSVLLNRERLEVGKVVGEGEFGCVTEAKLRLEGNRYMTVAVKTMKSRSSKQDVESFVTEALRMKDFHHPNIMSLIGLIMEPPETRFLPVKAMVVLPFMKHGDLHTFLLRSRLADKPKFVPIQTLLKFSVDIAKGMEYLGQMEFLHRDLAARNCMLDEQLVVKVADFGLSRKIYCENYYRQGSMVKVPVKWLAMESLADRVYTTQSDVWSFGVTLWEIITRGATPYPGVANHEVYDLLLKGLRLQKPRDCSDQLYQIMYSCWRINPKHRPSFNFLVRKLHTMLSAMPPPPSIDNSFYENTSNVIKLTDSEACFQDTEC